MTGSFLPDIPVPNLPNPLKRLTLGSDPLADTVDIGFTPSPEGVVAQAKKSCRLIWDCEIQPFSTMIDLFGLDLAWKNP